MSIAIITGASSGIGASFAKKLDSVGLSEIWITARRIDRLEALAEELSTPVRVIGADLTISKGLGTLTGIITEEKPDISYLINNAGFGKVGSFTEISLEDTLGMITLQVSALTEITHTALPYMKKGSTILLVSSLASFVSMPGFATYSAVKAYITNLGYSLYRELKPRGIHVTTICPGPVKTEFGARAQFTVVSKGTDVVAEDITSLALADAQRKLPFSMFGATPKLTKWAIRILGNRISSFIIWHYMQREMSKQNLR
ncbi:MAG: SDR family NAD(P)-dependent oxidoreductase [Fibrobacterales bacterium]